jgi:hypothetical protein
MNQLILQYTYLQLLDFLTTMAFLVQGVQEGNPLVRFAISNAPHPMTGLLLVKAVALSLGFYCWRQGRQKVLARMNWFFAAIVAWNILSMIVGAVSRGAVS